MARFFLPKEQIQNRRGTIVGAELDHLRRVLRLGPGDTISFFDDAGWEYEGIIRSLGSDRGEIEILGAAQARRESTLNITLALGLTKGEKMDWVVEKATELGVQNVVPFVSAYTVPKLDDRKIQKRAERWRKIAISAAKQCGRTHIPEILPLCAYPELIGQAWPETLKLLFWEKEAHQSLHQVHALNRAVRSVLLVIGPEGGFNSQEAELAGEHGFKSVQLGRRILRAETAALTATSLAQFLWGDLG